MSELRLISQGKNKQKEIKIMLEQGIKKSEWLKTGKT